MVVFKFARKLHEHFLLGDDISERLNNLLYFIIEPRLRPDVVESLYQLFHDFTTVLLIFSAQHTHQVHNALYKTAVVEV